MSFMNATTTFGLASALCLTSTMAQAAVFTVNGTNYDTSITATGFLGDSIATTNLTQFENVVATTATEQDASVGILGGATDLNAGRGQQGSFNGLTNQLARLEVSITDQIGNDFIVIAGGSEEPFAVLAEGNPGFFYKKQVSLGAGVWGMEFDLVDDFNLAPGSSISFLEITGILEFMTVTNPDGTGEVFVGGGNTVLDSNGSPFAPGRFDADIEYVFGAAPIPEPASLGLLGLAGLLVGKRARRN